MWLRCGVNETPKAAVPSIIYNTKQPILYSSFGAHVCDEQLQQDKS